MTKGQEDLAHIRGQIIEEFEGTVEMLRARVEELEGAPSAEEIKIAAKAIHALDVDWFGVFAWNIIDPQERAAYRKMAFAALSSTRGRRT